MFSVGFWFPFQMFLFGCIGVSGNKIHIFIHIQTDRPKQTNWTIAIPKIAKRSSEDRLVGPGPNFTKL